MATVRPFKGYRPLPKFIQSVAARPYDVLNSEEARLEAGNNPLSFLHVGKPEIDLPPGTNLYDDSVYQKGKENLEKLILNGILQQDKKPCFYLYAQRMGDHIQYGIVGCASVEEYLNNTIKRHELTRKDKEDDRTKHVIVTNAHTGPIFLTFHAQPALDAIIRRVQNTPTINDFVADDGIVHQLWVIEDDSTIGEIREAFSSIPSLYVADGHHRTAAAARAAQALASANPQHTGEEEYNYFLAVLFPHNQLHILDYNRVVKDLNGKTPEQYQADVQRCFTVVHTPAQARPTKKGEIGMYFNRQWYMLTIKPELYTTNDPVESLDISILQTTFLAPVLGIEDPRTNKRIDFVGGIRGLGELERRVNSGEMAVAFALYPTSIEELIAIADAGKIMPPKSTWFEPKLRDGMVIHFLS